MNNPSKLIKDIGWYRVPTAKSIGSFQYYNGWIDAYPVGNMDLSNYKYSNSIGSMLFTISFIKN